MQICFQFAHYFKWLNGKSKNDKLNLEFNLRSVDGIHSVNTVNKFYNFIVLM